MAPLYGKAAALHNNMLRKPAQPPFSKILEPDARPYVIAMEGGRRKTSRRRP